MVTADGLKYVIFSHFSIKETENLIFFRCKIDIYFTHEHQSDIFTGGFATRKNKAGEIKIDLTPKKSNILYT